MYCRWIPDWHGLTQVASFSLTLITVTILKNRFTVTRGNNSHRLRLMNWNINQWDNVGIQIKSFVFCVLNFLFSLTPKSMRNSKLISFLKGNPSSAWKIYNMQFGREGNRLTVAISLAYTKRICVNVRAIKSNNRTGR